MKNSKWNLVSTNDALGYDELKHLPILLSEADRSLFRAMSEQDIVMDLTRKFFPDEFESEDMIFDFTTGHVENSYGEQVFYVPTMYRVQQQEDEEIMNAVYVSA